MGKDEDPKPVSIWMACYGVRFLVICQDFKNGDESRKSFINEVFAFPK